LDGSFESPEYGAFDVFWVPERFSSRAQEEGYSETSETGSADDGFAMLPIPLKRFLISSYTQNTAKIRGKAKESEIPELTKPLLQFEKLVIRCLHCSGRSCGFLMQSWTVRPSRRTQFDRRTQSAKSSRIGLQISTVMVEGRRFW
jgi:hypothetical protein